MGQIPEVDAEGSREGSVNKRQKKKLFNKKSGFRLAKLPPNYQTWIFQYYTGIGAVTYKRICTEKIPDREKYLINTRNVENFNRLMRKRWDKNGNQKNCRNRRIL